MNRIRVGDTVYVRRGEDKGRRGKVMRVIKEKNRVIVEGVNQIKRHVRASAQNAGGILEVEAPIDMSKVMPIDPETDKPTRVGFKSQKDGKIRVGKSKAELPTPTE